MIRVHSAATALLPTAEKVMKIAGKKPDVTKSAVYVTDDRYEMWYSKPLLLGHIDKKNGYWITADGMRFINNRDALNYLIRIHELQHTGKLPEAEVRKEWAIKEARKVQEALEASREEGLKTPVEEKKAGAEAKPSKKKKKKARTGDMKKLLALLQSALGEEAEAEE